MKISQREAKRLQKRVSQLEQLQRDQANAWSREYVGGINIASAKFEPNSAVPTAIKTARRLNHAVVVTQDGDGSIYFYALPIAN